MIKLLIPAIAVAAGALACAPARADFSGCDAALRAKDPHQQIDLYTVCLKHGGLTSSDAAGALNNRGVAYQSIGETDKALQDYIAATKYDPGWPLFRVNRAAAEARMGQCAEALFDINTALKMAPHNKQFLELKDHIVADCPIVSKPSG